jgi:hypothetical protein
LKNEEILNNTENKIKSILDKNILPLLQRRGVG